MAYGLFRSDALRDCGVYRSVLLPDRLLMFELSLRGEFRQVLESLWWSRVNYLTPERKEKGTVERQKETLFEFQKSPRHIVYPWWAMFGSTFLKYYFLNSNHSKVIKKIDALWMSFYLLASQCFNETVKKFSMALKRFLRAMNIKIKTNKADRAIYY